MRVINPLGKDLSRQCVEAVAPGTSLVAISAEQGSGVYRIEPRSESEDVWNPFVPAAFDTASDGKWMLSIPAGIAYQQPSVFFDLPRGIRSFTIKVGSPPNTQPKLRLTLPNGQTLEGATRAWNVAVPKASVGCANWRRREWKSSLALEGILRL